MRELSTQEMSQPKKPNNAFFLYRKAMKAYIISTFGLSQSHEVVKQAAIMWRMESAEVKKKYKDQSNEEFARHKQRYPDYVWPSGANSIKRVAKRRASAAGVVGHHNTTNNMAPNRDPILQRRSSFGNVSPTSKVNSMPLFQGMPNVMQQGQQGGAFNHDELTYAHIANTYSTNPNHAFQQQQQLSSLMNNANANYSAQPFGTSNSYPLLSPNSMSPGSTAGGDFHKGFLSGQSGADAMTDPFDTNALFNTNKFSFPGTPSPDAGKTPFAEQTLDWATF